MDGSGEVYVTGNFHDAVDFDPGVGADEHVSTGVDDVFLSKFDLEGKFQWARTWGGISFDDGYGVVGDNFGNVYVTGGFRYTVDFDPGPGVDEHTAVNGSHDAFLIKFPPDGNW